MRQTSIDSFHQIQQDGTLSKRQIEVLNLVRAAGKITGRAIGRAIPGGWKRLAELKAMGAVIDDTTGKDPCTGKTVSLWRTTDQPLLCPPAKPRKPSRTDLEAEIVRLTKELDRRVERAAELYDLAYKRGYQDCSNGIKFCEEE